MAVRARLKYLSETTMGTMYLAQCGNCGQIITRVENDQDGYLAAFSHGYRQADNGVWHPTKYAKEKHQRRRQSGRSVRFSVARGWHQRDRQVEIDHLSDPDSPLTRFDLAKRLPVEFKCPRCPTINLITVAED